MNARLGNFDLQFEPSGKLAGISVDGVSPFLADNSCRHDFGDGRWFEPRGWDECFPTIEAHGPSPVMGDLVWLPPRLRQSETEVSQEWEAASYTATRRFRADGARQLVMEFSVRNRGTTPLPFLWASHALFTFQGLRRVEFADGGRLDDFSLDGSSSKTFRLNKGPARLVREDGEVVLESDQRWWGIWLNRGGWPAERPAGFGCLGLEAATTPAEHPDDGEIPRRGCFTGTVRMEVRT
jgi:hypothetical protein